MDNTKERALFRATEEKRLVSGVMTDVPEGSAGGSTWHLVSAVRPDLLDTLRSEQRRALIMCEVFGRDGCNSFWVLGYQGAAVQQRFLLPLVGPSVGAMIDQVAHRGIRLLMHSALDAPVLEVEVPVPLDIHATLRAHHQAIEDPHKILREQAQALAMLLDPNFLTRVKGLPRPSTVSVSSVLPVELVRLSQRKQADSSTAPAATTQPRK